MNLEKSSNPARIKKLVSNLLPEVDSRVKEGIKKK
jgi:hypothetical protein